MLANNTEALLQSALHFHQKNELEKALTLYKQILATDSEVADAWHLQGRVLFALGKQQQGIESVRHAINISPDYIMFHLSLSDLLRSKGDISAAIDQLQIALQYDSTSSQIYFSLGRLYQVMNNFKLAQISLQQALIRDTDNAEIYANLAYTSLKLKDLKTAKDFCETALSLNKDLDEAYCTMAQILQAQGYFTESLSYAEKAIKLAPNLAVVYNTMGAGLYYSGSCEQALTFFNRAIELDPTYKEAHYNKGMALLTLGNLQEGWQEHEWRASKRQVDIIHGQAAQPWQGEPLIDKNILILPEQGLGDEILFSSCFAEVIAQCKECIIICEPRLQKIFTHSFPGAVIIAATRHDLSWQHLLPPINYYISNASIPLYLRNNMSSFPERHQYLTIEEKYKMKWQQRLKQLPKGKKIGFAWRSSIIDSRRQINNLQFDAYQKLLQLPGIQWINLQYDALPAEIEQLNEKYNIKLHAFTDIDLKNDLDNTGALLTQLDLVISTANSLVTFAGALGTPTWMLSYYPLYVQLGTDNIPWLPSVTAFTASKLGGWDKTVRLIETTVEKIDLQKFHSFSS